MAIDQTGSSPELDAQGSEATTAETPNAEGKPTGETEDNLLAVVQSVVDKSTTTEAEASTAESPTAETSESVTEKPEASKEDDFSNVPFNKHPRFQALVQEKNTYKAKLAEYEPDAQQYRQIQQFMETNRLTAEEVAEELALLAEMKVGDPAKAAAKLTQRLEQLQLAAGEKLPAELEQKVADGYVDRETATAMHRKAVAAERKAEQAEQDREARARQDAQQQVQRVAGAVGAWELATKAADPDFDLKVDLVKDRVRALVAANGMPKTADEAVALSKQAYEHVTGLMRRAVGTKPAMRPAVGGKSNGTALPQPTSLLDVVRQASGG